MAGSRFIPTSATIALHLLLRGICTSTCPKVNASFKRRIRLFRTRDRPPGTPAEEESKGAGGGASSRGTETPRLCLRLRDPAYPTQEFAIPAPVLSGTRCWEPGQQDFLSPQLPAPLPPRPGRPLPAQVPHSRCTRGPCRGTAALARIALRSQLLPYSAQHDWGGAVSGSGEDERG